MSELSATGPSVGGVSPNVERPLTQPGMAAPAPSTATGTPIGTARGDAVALVALARLERDHVALLSALCDLEAPARRRAKSSGTQALSAAMRDALAVLLRADLRQTQHALALAAEGRYGVCEGCQASLSSVALLTTPATTHCPSCAGSTVRASQVH